MSPPRRSLRFRGSSSSSSKPNAIPSRRLSRLTERDETQTDEIHSNFNTAASSPVIPRTPATIGRIRPPFEEMHPGKAHSTSSPSFDFRYARPAPILGLDAQKMMDEIREEALRIKAQLAAERQDENRNITLDATAATGGRRIATPKGKVGRFSDVHMAEFKKMDSIAGHASAYRTQPGRFTTATTAAFLKRSQSKAKLDSREEVSRVGYTSSQPESLENTPAKRARTLENQNSPHTLNSKLATPTLSRSRSILSSVTTPTQASLARAVRASQTSQIPTQSPSPSKFSLTAPRRFIKSATVNNLSGMTRSESIQNLSSTVRKLDRFKSILRRPIIGAENPTATTQASIPTMTNPSRPNLDKELPSTPITSGLESSKSAKYIDITPRTIFENTATLQSSLTPVNRGLSSMMSSTRPNDVYYPSLTSMMMDDSPSKGVDYPILTPNRPLPEAPGQAKAKLPPPSVPGTFTFRSDKIIDFSIASHGFGSSPGQSSIRKVRPSICPSRMPETLPDSNKENFGRIPVALHGVPNKKRRRVDPDEARDDKEAEGSPLKKRKDSVANMGTLKEYKLQAEKITRKSKIPSPSKKGVLSLSRLNMLARPKTRK